MDFLDLLTVAGLLFFNGFFVAAEFALVKVRTSQIDQLAEAGNWSARLTGKIQRGATLPASFARTNALDFYGYWKWLDALTDAAFFGLHRDLALGGTEAQKFMGTWSDGQPVKPAVVELAK